MDTVAVVLCLPFIGISLWLGPLVEALSVPDHIWARAGQTKIMFVLLMLLLPFVGLFLYVAIARPGIHQAALAAVR